MVLQKVVSHCLLHHLGYSAKRKLPQGFGTTDLDELCAAIPPTRNGLQMKVIDDFLAVTTLFLG